MFAKSVPHFCGSASGARIIWSAGFAAFITTIKKGNKNKISKTIPSASRILFFTLSPAIILHFLLSALAKLNLYD